MGEEIILRAIEVKQGGTLQMDFWNPETRVGFRVFCDPAEFFSMLGKAMQVNADKWMKSFETNEKRALAMLKVREVKP